MGAARSKDEEQTIILPRLHAGQRKAYQFLMPHRLGALRCGRRFGKTELAKAYVADGILKGESCGWFAPQHKLATEVFEDLGRMLAPILIKGSRGEGVMRFVTGGRLDFWSLENPSAGRSRGYHRVVIDEAAFAKDADSPVGPMMEIWERSIKPTLHDYAGRALVCSNSAGKNLENFFYNICNDPKFGFREYHATTMDNPLLPVRHKGEADTAWGRRRAEEIENLKRDNAPLVFAQEYLAEFVDWSGEAFFVRDKLLVDGQPVPYPNHCDSVFAVIDTASKTGTDNDATAVTYFARDRFSTPLRILDWDIRQIEGALLETWLPGVFVRLEELARLCGARAGSLGAFIEDMNSGTILLQQAMRAGQPVHAIESKLTAMGKDERAISVSGCVYRGEVKYTAHAFHKTIIYKERSENHFLNQVEGFRVGDKKGNREDDLLDTFCYGIALALGNNEGF